MPSNRYFFLHIPKTAGSSLNHVLSGVASPYLHIRHPHEFHWTATRVWSRFRGCGGHINWAGAEQLGFLSGFTITFLRDPVRRVLSQYAFSRQSDHGGSTESILAHSHAIHELFQASAGHFGPFGNMQTFALSGLPQSERDPEKHLASALTNLEMLAFLGTAETFRDDVRELARALGHNEPFTVPRENTTHAPIQPSDLSPETLALVERSQALDRILYQRALELRGTRRYATFKREAPPPPGWPPARVQWGTGSASITAVSLRPLTGERLRSGEVAELNLDFETASDQEGVTLGLKILDLVGNYIAGTNSLLLTGKPLRLSRGSGGGCFRFALSMGPGRYVLTLALHRDYEDLCWIDSAIDFEVLSGSPPFREGLVSVDARFLVQPRTQEGPLVEEEAKQMVLEVRSHRTMVDPQSNLSVSVRLVNHGTSALRSDGPHPVVASYHWVGLEPGAVVHDGIRTRLPHAVWPGEEVEFGVAVQPPPTLGRWHLQIRILQEGIRWHEGPGFEACIPSDLLVEHASSSSLRVIGSTI